MNVETQKPSKEIYLKKALSKCKPISNKLLSRLLNRIVKVIENE